MSDLESWLTEPPKWAEIHRKMIQFKKPLIRQTVSLKDVVKNSKHYNLEFPINTIQCQTLLSTVPKQILERNVQSAYPVIHERVLHLCANFLLLKLEHGTSKEKKLYNNMTVIDFIERLLSKRAVMFVGRNDLYMLRDDSDGMGNWESIGTENERKPLILSEYLSYDEIKLSAFLSVSSYSYFINSGTRYNNGKTEEHRENIQPEGIIIGLIGTRLAKRNVMEFQEIVICQTQNTVLNGYGDCNTPNIHNLFANFYESNPILYDNVRYGPLDFATRFTDLQSGYIFDNLVYAKRLAVSFDTLLLEANHRAKERSKFAYVHVIGIGLGVWRASLHQEDVFVTTFGKRISVLGTKLNNISDIHFSYFQQTLNCCGYADKDLFPISGHPNGGIRIFISEREPFTKLEQPDKLLVVSYAWDGNSLPGNEFWKGCTSNSSDSSTAASSQVAEIHNPMINKTVCANNLMVVTGQGVVHIYQYFKQVEKMLNDGKAT